MSTGLPMSGRSTPGVVVRVAQREFRERIRQRTFILSTIFSALIIVVLAVLPALIDRPTRWSVGVSDERSRELAEGVRALLVAGEPDATLTITGFDTEAEGRRAVDRGEIGALIVATDPTVEPQVVVERRLSDERASLLSVAIQRLRLVEQADSLGISTADALRLAEPGRFSVAALRPPDERRADDVRMARIASLLMFVQVLTFGAAVASGVVEEKSSRVVELLLARVRPTTLLAGKLLGIGALGLAQTAAFVGIGLLAVSLAGTATVGASSVGLGVALLVWFALGYALFSTLFLVAGALAGRAEDLQSTMSLAVSVCMASMFAVTFAGEPDSAVMRIISFIPSVAPLSMPLRSAAGEAPLVEVLGSIAALVVAIALLVFLAAAVYRRTVLSTTQQSLFRVLRRRDPRS